MMKLKCCRYDVDIGLAQKHNFKKFSWVETKVDST